MEIGGYIEFTQFNGSIFHDDAIALNSGRNCLAYLIESKNIKRIAIPKFLCDSVSDICKKYNLDIRYYSIGKDFLPQILQHEDGEWIYLVNYYGQIDNNQIVEFKQKYKNIIVDNVQAFFQKPVQNVDTIYTCRKFFGVSDGAFLYTDKKIDRKLEIDISYNRMIHLLGRYEETASMHYTEYTNNEMEFSSLPLRRMSKLTRNLLRGINYDEISAVRERNFLILDNMLCDLNQINLRMPCGAFMYPLYMPNGVDIRKKLQEEEIYIPTLWSDVFEICDESETEFDMAKNILPLPCDQRYNIDDMLCMVEKIKMYLK